MNNEIMQEIKLIFENGIDFINEKTIIKDAEKVQKNIINLVKISALEKGHRKKIAQYVIRSIAECLGIFPASINQLYIGRGEGKVPFTFTVPAINLRVLTYDAARAVFRAARKLDASALIFEIARSEMNYTDQRPAEYSASVLGAAIAEGYQGPVFIQGDHFQVSAKRYLVNPQLEIKELEKLIIEAIKAGFYNIDIDTSTLVDLEKQNIQEQQKLNIELSKQLTVFVREYQPRGLEISIGGEIGEVGGQNSTELELRTYLEGFQSLIKKQIQIWKD